MPSDSTSLLLVPQVKPRGSLGLRGNLEFVFFTLLLLLLLHPLPGWDKILSL